METQYKIIYRDESGSKAGLTIPAYLIENRKELWRAAFRDATARLHDEVKGSTPEQLYPLVAELSAKHKEYFNEYMDGTTVSRALVENAELAWAATLDETMLKQLGKGDVDVGISELIIAICLIADDQMEPLAEAYRRTSKGT